jgi:excisionase family DNA binding protein
MVKQTNLDMELNLILNKVNYIDKCIAEIANSNNDLNHRMREFENGGFNGKEVLTIDEAGFFLGYTRGYLYKLTQSSSIPFHKPTGKTILFIRSELVEWVKSDGVIKGNAI